MAETAQTPTQIAMNTGQNAPTYDSSGNYNGNTTIPVTSLASANPIQTATPTPDTTNYSGIIAGSTQDLQDKATAAQAKADSLQSQENDPNNPSSVSNQILKLMGQENNKAADTQAANDTAGVTALNKQLNSLNAQAKNLNLASQAIPIQTQQNNANTGATDAGVAPQTAGALRENALKSLSLSQQANIATGDLASAQAAAKQVIDLKYLPIENQLATLKQQYMTNEDFLKSVNAKAATALQASITKQTNNVAAKKVTEQQNSAAQVTWANNAYAAGQSDISSQIIALDPSSPTFNDDLAKLQTQVKQTPAQLYQIAQANALNGTPGGTGTPTGAGSGAINIANITGVTDTTQSLSSVIASVGMDALVRAVIKNEGGTPQGTNNPGNIKFAGQPGATKGKAAPDGGNYANFDTPARGQQAIANQIQAYASSGKTFQDAFNTYTGTQPKANAIGTTGSPTMDITKSGYTTDVVPGTGITQSAIDQDALASILGQPLPVPLSKAGTGQAQYQKNAINNRVGEMNSGGNIAANKAQLTADTASLKANQGYIDSVQGALNSADGGGQWVIAHAPTGINTNDSTFLNTKLNDLTKVYGNSDNIRRYQTDLYEIGNEYAQVFARGGVRSESGNQEAQSIINGNITIKDLKGVLDDLQSIGKINIAARQAQNDVINGRINSIIGGHPGLTTPTTGGSWSLGGYTLNIPQATK